MKRYSSRLLLKSQLRSGMSGLQLRPSDVAILKVSSAMNIWGTHDVQLRGCQA